MMQKANKIIVFKLKHKIAKINIFMIILILLFFYENNLFWFLKTELAII